MKQIIDKALDVTNDVLKGIIGYLKGEMILMSVTFIILSAGLYIIKAPLPLLIAFGITIFDLLPVLGSGMIMIPWAIISLIAKNTQMAAGVAILYIVLVISRQILEPVIIGKSIGLRPLITFAAGIAGSLIFGPVGLIAGPLIAIAIKSAVKKQDGGVSKEDKKA